MGTPHRTRRTTARFIAGLLTVPLLYVAVTGAQVWWAAGRTAEVEDAAEAIVVLGAAQYDGRPSAALRGRLDHAAQLFEEDLAPLIVVTGGRRKGDRFTEAGASARYLERQAGIPGSAIERETTGASSYTSLAATARFLRDRGIERVVLVSDPFHNYRITAIAEELGLRPQASASTTSPFSGRSELRQVGRETVAVALGRLVGYRRVESLGLRLDQLRVRTVAR